METDKTETKHNIALYALLGCILIAIFFLGRISHSPTTEIKLPDTSKLENRYDSVCVVNTKLNINSNLLTKKIDSLNLLQVKNIKKVNNGIKEVNNFTPSAREHWNDSVLKSNGLK